MRPAGSGDLKDIKLWIIVCLFLKASVQAVCRKGSQGTAFCFLAAELLLVNELPQAQTHNRTRQCFISVK